MPLEFFKDNNPKLQNIDRNNTIIIISANPYYNAIILSILPVTITKCFSMKASIYSNDVWKYCQAQPKPQLKLSWHPPNPTRKSSNKLEYQPRSIWGTLAQSLIKLISQGQ